MKKILTDVIKNALVLFATGTAISLLAPYIGAATLPAGNPLSGVLKTLGENPLSLGAMLGSLGAMTAVVGPLMDKIFDNVNPPPAMQLVREPSLDLALSHELEPEIGKSFAAAIAESRAQKASSQQLH